MAVELSPNVSESCAFRLSLYHIGSMVMEQRCIQNRATSAEAYLLQLINLSSRETITLFSSWLMNDLFSNNSVISSSDLNS